MEFLNTFRGRLLLILALLLIATLGVQYYLNLRTQRENSDLRAAQEQTIVAGIALGFTSMTSKEDRLQDLMQRLLSPHRPMQPGPTSIHEILERVRSLLLAEFPGALTIRRDYDTSLPDLIGDREQLIQAILNIARNAAQAGFEGCAASSSSGDRPPRRTAPAPRRVASRKSRRVIRASRPRSRSSDLTRPRPAGRL